MGESPPPAPTEEPAEQRLRGWEVAATGALHTMEPLLSEGSRRSNAREEDEWSAEGIRGTLVSFRDARCGREDCRKECTPLPRPLPFSLFGGLNGGVLSGEEFRNRSLFSVG